MQPWITFQPLTDLTGKLGISVPTVSVVAQRGRKTADREKLDINLLMNIKI